jgi:hypothetical protein
MSRMLGHLVRFAVIILGYLAASLAASAFIHVLFLGALGWTPEEVPFSITGPLVFTVPLVALFVAYFAFIPSFIVILATEFLGRRDWLTYALAGGLVSLAIGGIMWSDVVPAAEADAALPSIVNQPRVMLLMLGAGIVGGIAYWLVAGRRASGFPIGK